MQTSRIYQYRNNTIILFATQYKNDQCRISPTLPPQNAYRGPLMVIYNKSFRRNVTSRGRMAFKTKYPNCRHNFGRTRPV